MLSTEKAAARPGRTVHSSSVQTHWFSRGWETQASAPGSIPVPGSARALAALLASSCEGPLAALHGLRTQEHQRQLMPGLALLPQHRRSGKRPFASCRTVWSPQAAQAQGCWFDTSGASGTGVSHQDLATLHFTGMEILIYLFSVLAVLKLEKEFWKVSLPLEPGSKAATGSSGSR